MPLQEAIHQAYKNNIFANEIIATLHTKITYSKKITLSLYNIRDNKLYYQDRLYMPNNNRLRTHICEAHHTTPATGHGSRARTLNLIQRSYFWPKIHQIINRYVRNCHICSRAKSRRHTKYSVLRSLPVP